MKRQKINLSQYKKKYKNLDHLYFSRKEILIFLEKYNHLIYSYHIFHMPKY